MAAALLVAKKGNTELALLPALANRHGLISGALVGSTGPRGSRQQGIVESMAKSAARAIGSGIGRQNLRGVLGSILGSAKKR